MELLKFGSMMFTVLFVCGCTAKKEPPKIFQITERMFNGSEWEVVGEVIVHEDSSFIRSPFGDDNARKPSSSGKLSTDTMTELKKFISLKSELTRPLRGLKDRRFSKLRQV